MEKPDLQQVFNEYSEAVYDTDRRRALEVIENAVAAGVSPEDIVFKVVIPSVEQMIQAISKNMDTNLSQHFMASQIAADVTERMTARFAQTPEVIGRVVIGTSSGDLHTLGKRIVTGCLKSLMIEVVDIGVNVPAEKFVDEALRTNAQVIAISSMMVHTARSPNGCLKVRQLLKSRGLEGQIKIVVGGAPYRFDPELYKVVKADGWAPDGISAGRLIGDFIRQVDGAHP